MNNVREVGEAVGNGVRSAGRAVVNGARSAGEAVGNGVRSAGRAVVNGARSAGEAVVSGVEAVAPYTLPGMAYNFGSGFINGIRGDQSAGDQSAGGQSAGGQSAGGQSAGGGNARGGTYYTYPGTGDYKWYPGLDVRDGSEMDGPEIPNRWPDEIEDDGETDAEKRQGVIDRLHQAEKEKRAGFTSLDIDLSDIDDKALADLKSGTESDRGISRGPVVDPKDRAYNEMKNTYSNKQLRQYKRGKINNALSVGQNDWQRKQTVRAIKNGMEERPTDYKAVSRSRRSARNGGVMMRTFLSAMRRGGRL